MSQNDQQHKHPLFPAVIETLQQLKDLSSNLRQEPQLKGCGRAVCCRRQAHHQPAAKNTRHAGARRAAFSALDASHSAGVFAVLRSPLGRLASYVRWQDHSYSLITTFGFVPTRIPHKSKKKRTRLWFGWEQPCSPRRRWGANSPRAELRRIYYRSCSYVIGECKGAIDRGPGRERRGVASFCSSSSSNQPLLAAAATGGQGPTVEGLGQAPCCTGRPFLRPAFNYARLIVCFL